ncbi:hypothetical protein F0U60_10375 [Archangium minus]|uniref:Lipoprotein n=1 Tax=Archangium minus TaxID=83450 RepID=A0ABY9WKX9_9BACT|nr:hypothetical protein F0U60_10375 [Archangium minus]
MTLESSSLLLAMVVLTGCFEARADDPWTGVATPSAPNTCDVTKGLIEKYFGSEPRIQFGHKPDTEIIVGSHAQYLCRAGEPPLHIIEQKQFLRCVWYRAFEDPIIISLSESCVITRRRPTEINGEYRVDELTQSLARPECTKILTSALESIKDGAGKSDLTEDMSGLDGEALYFEYRDRELRRAGYVDTPVVDSGATGAVKACILVQEPLRKISVSTPR